MKLRNPFLFTAALQPAPQNSSKAFLTNRLLKLHLTLALLLLLASSGVVVGQQVNTRAISFPVSIQWAKQNGVTKYRLQIASDENFHDIFFDGRVNGERYTANTLPPGYYFWRTAPADYSTGNFSKPVRFFVSGGALMSVPLADKSTRKQRVRTVSKSH